MKSTATLTTQYDADEVRGKLEGLYGRMPGDMKKLCRKIADAPNYDFAAMELLDALNIDWRN